MVLYTFPIFFPQLFPLAHRKQFWQRRRTAVARSQNDFRSNLKRVKKQLFSLTPKVFSWNDLVARRVQIWKNCQRKVKVNRWINKRTKKNWTILKNVAGTRKYRPDNRAEVFQHELKRFSIQSPKMVEQFYFMKELIFINSFLWITWMEIWRNWKKLFVWKFKKSSLKIKNPKTRTKNILSKKKTFFLQKDSVDT